VTRSSIPFELRGRAGEVQVEYLVNEDPGRWGYPELQMEDLDIEAARGAPVVQATVEYPAEGYAAILGWIQIVEHGAVGGESETIVDVAPQMHASGAGMPYMSFGIQPILFDAPGTDEPDSDFRAVSFLTASPDALMTPVVGPLCGFRWGYRTRNGRPEPAPLEVASNGDWAWMKATLGDAYPRWTFLDPDWQA
jgi:hypothetical protein